MGVVSLVVVVTAGRRCGGGRLVGRISAVRAVAVGVAVAGRQAAGAGTFRSRGVRRRKSDGVMSTRLAVRKRTVGAMPGKDTWSDAERMVFDEAPRLISEAKVKQIRAIFR